MMNRKYSQAMNHLLTDKRFSDAVIEFVIKRIHEECLKLKKGIPHFQSRRWRSWKHFHLGKFTTSLMIYVQWLWLPYQRLQNDQRQGIQIISHSSWQHHYAYSWMKRINLSMLFKKWWMSSCTKVVWKLRLVQTISYISNTCIRKRNDWNFTQQKVLLTVLAHLNESPLVSQ